MKHNYAIYAASAIMALVAFSEARAGGYGVIEVRHGAATVRGIPDAPSAERFYQPGARIMSRPSAGIAYSADALGFVAPAPPNGCEAVTGGFRSMSGPDRGTCYARTVPVR